MAVASVDLSVVTDMYVSPPWLVTGCGADHNLNASPAAPRPSNPPGRVPGSARGSDGDHFGVTTGQHVRQFPAGMDAEFVEHVAQVPFDGPRAEEELCADLGVRQALAGEPRDLALLRGQIVASLDGSPPHLLAGGLKLLAGALGERLHADRGQHLVGRAQLVARVDPAVLAAQPLPVEQMSPGELGTPPGPCQSLDRLAIQALGALTLAQECPAARLYSPAPVGVAGRGRCHHALERTGRHIGFLGADRRFDQLNTKKK